MFDFFQKQWNPVKPERNPIAEQRFRRHGNRRLQRVENAKVFNFDDRGTRRVLVSTNGSEVITDDGYY